MRKLTLAEQAPVSADKAWSVIGDFSAIRKWAPIVDAESTVETPEGKLRTLVLRGGRTVSELMTSGGAYHYTYTLERPDMKSYHSTVAVAPIDESAAMIELTVQFEPADGVEMADATDGFVKFLSGNLKAMKRAIAAG